MPEPRGSPWTTLEIEAIVADYIRMLGAELRGEPFVKAHHNRALQQLIGRSKGSIEYKYQNISAVMEEFGLPFIRGYKPAKNYQRALFEAIADQLLSQDRSLARIAEDPPATGAVPDAGLIYQAPPPPPGNVPRGLRDPAIQSIVRRFDPAVRDARARALGEAGERFLYCAEKNRLSAAGKDALAARVRWVSKEDGDGAGYDILSFSIHGEPRWLEVKTTNGPARTPFWISENERRVSEERRDVFRLARLYHFSRRPEAYRLKPPLGDHVKLTPSQYLATF